MVAALDTNIVVDLLRNQNEAPTKILVYNTIYLPITVCGELLFGSALSGKPVENKRNVLLFLGKCVLLEYNLSVAESYADIREHLQAKGKPIPENDIWIAATAVAFGLKLITRDRHFINIDRLDVEFWQ